VLFRCEQCAERGSREGMNFLLSRSSNDQTDLEVACEGQVVRWELP
jgi:hypothetical protein